MYLCEVYWQKLLCLQQIHRYTRNIIISNLTAIRSFSSTVQYLTNSIMEGKNIDRQQFPKT